MKHAITPEQIKTPEKIQGFPAAIIGSYEATYTLQLLTKDNVYYCNGEEGDECANTMCFTHDMTLLSNNYFAFSALYEALLENKDIIWMSELTAAYQKEVQAENA